MFRFIIGLLLLGSGIYFAWDANHFLRVDISELEASYAADEVLSDSEFSVVSSPIAEFAYLLGADTIDDLRNYISAIEVVCILVAIAGAYIVFSRLWNLA